MMTCDSLICEQKTFFIPNLSHLFKLLLATDLIWARAESSPCKVQFNMQSKVSNHDVNTFVFLIKIELNEPLNNFLIWTQIFVDQIQNEWFNKKVKKL